MHVMMFLSIQAAGKPHLHGDDRYARLAGQRQADVHKLVKGVATCPTDRALQGALQLPREYVIDGATAPAAGISPCLSSLCPHRALPF